ncbi:MAG: hypothetical protein ONB17_12485 [candidate division KSB1 bacterium]|nr:hypothetical protein [candidate division KSB1 bacterium]
MRQWLDVSPVVDRASLSDMYRTLVNNGVVVHQYGWALSNYQWERLHVVVISGTVASVHTPILYPLTLGEVVAALGEPEYAEASAANYADYCTYGIEVFYPSLGVEFYADDIPGGCEMVTQVPGTNHRTGPIEPGFNISAISCHVPGSLAESFQYVFGATPQDSLMMADHVQEWPGFGQIQLFEPYSR